MKKLLDSFFFKFLDFKRDFSIEVRPGSEVIKRRVDSRLWECDNYAFSAVLAPKFKFPAWLLPQNAEIWLNSSNPVRMFGPSVCILVPLSYSICLISLISADLVFWRDLISIGWRWIDHFYFRFYKNAKYLLNKMQKKDNDSVQTDYRNLKLQTNKLLYLVGPQKIKKKVGVQRRWMAWQGNLYHFWGISNCFLPTMVASGMCHFVIYFQKHIILEKRVLWLHLFIFKSDTPPTLLPLSLSNTFKGQGYCGWGVNRTGQCQKTTPARFFLGVDLVFFKGWLSFLRGEGLVSIFFRKAPLPIWFAGWPPFGNTGGELTISGQILESTLKMFFMLNSAEHFNCSKN